MSMKKFLRFSGLDCIYLDIGDSEKLTDYLFPNA